MRIPRLIPTLLAPTLLALACGTGPATEPPTATDELPSFNDFFDSKTDTGYVGTRAAEIEATFTGLVRVELPGRTAEELASIATDLRENGDSWRHRDITGHITDQIKYARNALKEHKLNLNLEGGSPDFASVTVEGEALQMLYTIRIESLVKFKDLEEDGLTPADLVGRTIEAKLPLVPEGFYGRAGACASDPDSGGPVNPEDLREDNFFYYFDADAEGCELTDDDLSVAHYVIESSLDAPTVYPEYHLLTADGRVDMVALFGQITHGELESNDWGFIAYRSFTRLFERNGFRIVETFPDNMGQRLERTYSGGLVVSLEMHTPVGYADKVPRDEANARFREAIKNHEIVYYNGHAFYGSLTVLDDPEVYPADVYQVMFMDACWSYAYYTKQIFRNRATPEDPDGYRLTDVVNNTEPGITGSNETAAILYENMLEGAARSYAGRDASNYSWNNLIHYMNEHAEVRAERRWTLKNPEIYGVSGVTTNVWPNVDRPVAPEGTVFETTGPVAIPDDDDAGATLSLEVPAGHGTLTAVTIEVDIRHTYIGDLTVTLEHGGRTVVLHERSGGGTDDLSLRVTTDELAGLEAEGRWTVSVVDSARIDEGTIERLSVELP